MESHTKDQLYWAGGHLDGDGSVGLYGPWHRLSVSVGKAENGYSTLYEFQRLFDGIIIKNKDADEYGQAAKSWVLNGVKALEFCKLITPYVQLKKPQFLKATEFPLSERKGVSLTEDLKNKRIEIATYLKNHKHIEHAVINDDLPNSYYAGMFDADGTISVTGFNQIRVSINQKYIAICENMVNKFTGGIQKTKDRDIYRWSIVNKDGSFNFLNCILPYSIEKKPQIEIVLNMKCNDAQNVKKTIEKLKGLQGVKNVKDNDKLIPLKKLDGLPKYISHAKNKNGDIVGYVVQYKGQSKTVSVRYLSMEDKFEIALEVLEEFKEKPIKKKTDIPKLKVVFNEDLPEHFRQVERDGKVIGYSIRYNGRKTRCTDKKKTLEQKFKLMQEQLKKFQDM